MARGGYRENAGRKSEWVSSSQTQPIRVPEWMAEEVLEFARKLDKGQPLDSVQNQKLQSQGTVGLENLYSIVKLWLDRASGKETSPRWQNVSKLLEEISEAMKEV